MSDEPLDADGTDLANPTNPERMAEFMGLYSSHYPRLQFYVMALAPKAGDAADILQETSMVLWRKFDSFEPGSNFFAWACKIARLQTLKFRERQGRSAQLFELSVLEKIADQAFREASGSTLQLEALDSCIKKLSAQDRALIRKRYQPGMSVSELARDAGRSANSLSQTLGRIRRALLHCIEHTITVEGRK
jgi:RNA polymerase sigma-70 factor (ECF subfamily)